MNEIQATVSVYTATAVLAPSPGNIQSRDDTCPNKLVNGKGRNIDPNDRQPSADENEDISQECYEWVLYQAGIRRWL